MRRHCARQPRGPSLHRPSQAQTRLRGPGPALLADAAGRNRRRRTTARSREARALGRDQRHLGRTDRGGCQTGSNTICRKTRAGGGAAGIAGRPRSGFCSGSSARIRRSTFIVRPAEPTMPSSTIGAGNVWSACQNSWCPSSARSTRRSPPLSRRSRVLRTCELGSLSHLPALTEAIAAAIASSIFLRRR